jgi:hypothetical protein
LQRILKRFAIAIDQLQDDPSIGQHNTGRFDEYFPMVKNLLDHLENAVNEWIINTFLEASDQGLRRVEIFENLLLPYTFPTQAFLTHAHKTLLTLTFYLGMDRPTRRLLKVYLRLGWLKLHGYYAKLTSIAYMAAVVLNPYRKLPFLSSLWHKVPSALATGYFNDCKRRLRELWKRCYKSREINGEVQQPAATTYNDYANLRLRFRNSLGNNNRPENRDRRRRRPDPTQIQDELDQYLSEPQVLKSLQNGDPMA